MARNTRRMDNTALWEKLTGVALMAPVSRNWAGDLQRGAALITKKAAQPVKAYAVLSFSPGGVTTTSS